MTETIDTGTPGGDTEDTARTHSGSRSRTALTVLLALALVLGSFAVGHLVGERRAENAAAATPTAGSVDVGFAQDMTVHHNQAIEMATIALTNAVDPLVKNLAYDIFTNQQNQVGQMQGWLALWDQPGLGSGGYMGWMSGGTDHSGMDHSGMDMGGTSTGGMDMGGSTVATMPGMASAQDMANLRAARGPAVDVLFLQLMLRHHQGGLSMMEYAAKNASVQAVRDLAQTMVNTQNGESTLMTNMLTEKGARPL